MSLFTRLAGVINSFFQIGGPGGVGWADVGATAIEAKDPTNTFDVNVRGADPVVPNDLVTKAYDDTAFKPIQVSSQWDGSVALPANTAAEHFYVVTTTGAFASIGQLLWDNGTGVGTVAVIPAPTGGAIIPTANLTGGAISFTAFGMYVWNGAAWQLIAVSTAGATQVILFQIGFVTASSVTSIPTGSTILRATLLVTTAYSPGATVQIGTAANPALYQGAADNDPQVLNTYDASQLTSLVGVTAPVQATVTAGAVAGAATVMVEYVATPNP